MSKFEIAVTGIMAWGFAFHTVVLMIASCGPIQHPATTWCRSVILVAPTRRTLEIWQDWCIPTAYFIAAAVMWYFGWQACGIFTMLGALACILRSILMHLFPARNFRPQQLHPLCHWM
ncbi:hypothetical protein [Burkholderia phage FLC9]|nr:hypothetical protein [Burkholderia phage FLC9]